ncbi:unnamed protein product [Rhizophagus irregularis]|nr:unnamed protein product [Rhizophagus irregularis]
MPALTRNWILRFQAGFLVLKNEKELRFNWVGFRVLKNGKNQVLFGHLGSVSQEGLLSSEERKKTKIRSGRFPNSEEWKIKIRFRLTSEDQKKRNQDSFRWASKFWRTEKDQDSFGWISDE